MAREIEIVKLCLKHLRQRNLTESFKALEKETAILLEDKNLTKLHEKVVIEGDFRCAEKLMSDFSRSEYRTRGLFDQSKRFFISRWPNGPVYFQSKI
jgi:hypothetical protein